MRFTLKELLLLVACFALGMTAFEVVSHLNLFTLIAFCVLGPTAAVGALAIIFVAVVRYHLTRRRNSQN